MLLPFVQLIAASIGLSKSRQRMIALPYFAFMSAQKVPPGRGDGGCDETSVNVAAQDLFASMITGGVAHGPVHPPKTEPVTGVALGVTCVPALYAPAPVIVPLPAPLAVMVSVYCQVLSGGGDGSAEVSVKVAVQDLFAFMITGGVAHGPVHPPKLEPLADVAVGMTCVPAMYTPAPVIVPLPVPLAVIASVYC